MSSDAVRNRSARRPRLVGGGWARLLLLGPMALLLLGSGCQPAASRAAGTFQAASLREPMPAEARPMQGDPGFSPDSLDGDAAAAYAALWESIDDPEQREYIDSLAASDDLYQYARPVQTYVVSLLTAFRLTGDLALLDRVDELAQLMRAQLHDSWRDVPRGASRSDGRDGYLNWVWRKSDSEEHEGRDLHETDEMRTHALIAEIAWAFEENRDLPSPAGVDYGERADFWLDYLRNHFEAKWRERNAVRWPRFPFLERPYVHPTLAFTKYHWYMHRLTGRREYLREATRLSDVLFREFHEVDTEAGPALVWRRSILSEGGDEDYLMPTDYSSLVIADALSLHLDGFYGWAHGRLPELLARTVTQFVIDNGSSDFARDVGGGERRAGIDASSASEWDRPTSTGFGINTFALLAAWDSSGEIAQVGREIYGSLPARHRYIYIPAGLLVSELLEPEHVAQRP